MKIKKLISFLAVLSITAAAITIPVSAEEENASAPEDYLLNLTFDEEGTGEGSYQATLGGTVTENGMVAYVDGKEGKALSISEKSAGNYLSLADGILDGKSAATYSFWMKSESDSTPNWAFMTTPESSHTYGKEKYVGMIATTSSYTVERYNNSGTRISSVATNGSYDDWKYVTVVAEKTATKIYVNGFLVASDDKTVDLSGLFTSTSHTLIGHANWGSGEGFQGKIDEFKIYGRALSETEIQALAGDEYTKEAEEIKKAEEAAAKLGAVPTVVEKSRSGNPMLGFDANGDTIYAGDPAAYVDGDTVYIYVGHDSATGEYYRMPEWLCYSSKDMENWKYEGVIMKASDISWRVDNYTAWASQVVKHNDKYYFYYCTTNKNANKHHSIGVAVSDSPTGPFTDIGAPVVNGYTMTTENTAAHNDIDPTVWVETVDGEEHRYLAWGNTVYYVCELNEDMTSVKDINGDGTVDKNDIKLQTINNLPAGLGYTEAPWIYRRTDENGKYTGKYYLFAAFGWREQMAYATSDTMWGPWEFGGVLMPPTATSNTNHPSVIDFKGKTYFIYHNGSKPWGSGFRRVVCAEEFTINEDGTIDPIQETSTGLTGTKSAIMQNGGYIYHDNFVNPSDDASYPLVKNIHFGKGYSASKDTQWEIVKGKADTENENYVSIVAVNKPGLYIAAQSDNSLVLTQDSNQNDTSMQKAMTFKTVKGLNGEEGSVSFESVLKSGYYLSTSGDSLTLVSSSDIDRDAATFEIGEALADDSISALMANVSDAWIKDGSSIRFYLNNAALYQNVSAYATEYKDGKLLGVGATNNIAVNSARQAVEIPYERKDNGSEIKIYVWKNMLPATEPTPVTVTENPYTMPTGYTSYFSFDENMNDTLTEAQGSIVGANISDSASVSDASYDTGYNGKAISFTGTGSYGVNLGNVITDDKYTVSFRMKANAFTACTSAMFINSGTKSSQKWVSAPFGDMSGGGTMIWSNDGSSYTRASSTGVLDTDKWHQVAIAADGTNVAIYIDGVKSGSGSIADIVTESTNTYLGVNFWDTPFNGLIDDLYIYNGTTLDDSQITALYEVTSK
jgi:hypothetical protein